MLSWESWSPWGTRNQAPKVPFPHCPFPETEAAGEVFRKIYCGQGMEKGSLFLYTERGKRAHPHAQARR